MPLARTLVEPFVCSWTPRFFQIPGNLENRGPQFALRLKLTFSGFLQELRVLSTDVVGSPKSESLRLQDRFVTYFSFSCGTMTRSLLRCGLCLARLQRFQNGTWRPQG